MNWDKNHVHGKDIDLKQRQREREQQFLDWYDNYMSDHLLGYVLRSFRTEEETSKLWVLIEQRLKKRTNGQSNAISMQRLSKRCTKTTG